MRAMSVIAVMLAVVTGVAVAEEWTADKVISAWRLGAPAEKILEQINDPVNTVAALSPENVAAMRAAGVPEVVVQALLAHMPRPAAAAPAPVPDNVALVDLVRLVRSGLSEKIIADQIRQGGVDAKPTVNDLIYLRESNVPDIIIVALMEAPLKQQTPIVQAVAEVAPAGIVPAVATIATASAAEEVVIEGLVYKRGGVFAKNRAGKVIVRDDKLFWRDAQDAAANFEMFLKGVDKVTLACMPRESGSFCYQIEFDFAKGDDYDFEDAARGVGGNESLMKLVGLIKADYPQIPVIEKTKK